MPIVLAFSPKNLCIKLSPDMHLKTVGPAPSPVKLRPNDVAIIANITMNGDALESIIGDTDVLINWFVLSWHLTKENIVEICINVLAKRAKRVPRGIDLIGLNNVPDEFDPAKIPPKVGRIIENVLKKLIGLCRIIQFSENRFDEHSTYSDEFDKPGKKIPKKYDIKPSKITKKHNSPNLESILNGKCDYNGENR